MAGDPIYGIDLGTTNSMVATTQGIVPEIISDQEGRSALPSVVCYQEDGQMVVGHDARELKLKHPEQCVSSVKRLIGKNLADSASLLDYLPYDVTESSSGALRLQVGERSLSPEEVSSHVLQALKQRVDKAGAPEMTRAVITVPAYFNELQRQATKLAGELAGLQVERIINEPTAAALAYGLDQKNAGTIAVFDLGGGTFDISILNIKDGVFKVLSTHGNTQLGGDDFDRVIVEVMLQAAGEQSSEQAKQNPQAMSWLFKLAEQAKIQLSKHEHITLVVDLPFLDFKVNQAYSRQEFETAIGDLVAQSIESCQQAITDADVTQVDDVVLVGGSTRVPLVKEQVSAFFNCAPRDNINPDEVVAQGAAVQGHILAGGSREVLLLDVIPLSLGIETVGGAVSKLIKRNQSIPAQAREQYTTSVDNQTAVLINVLQGERELAQHCQSLGEFKISGIPPMAASMPQIEVQFLVNSNGLLNVKAEEKRSGQAIDVLINPARGLSQEEIDRAVKDAITFSTEDFAEHRVINIVNEGKMVRDAALKSLNQAPADYPEEEKQAIQAVIDRMDEALEKRDAVLIEFIQEELNDVSEHLAHRLLGQVVNQLDQEAHDAKG